MGLFGKNEAHEMQQTQEIKEAAANQAPPTLDATPSTQQPQQDQANFVNPFSQNQAQMPQGQTQQPPGMPNLDSVPMQEPQTMQQQAVPQLDQTPTLDMPTNANMDEDRIKELIVENVEKIIDEKWERITDSIEGVVGWKDSVEKEIDLLKHDIVTIKEGFEQFEKRLMNKVNSYDRNILDVNSEIKALEKVFNKITPTLVNNVNELSKIADNLRGVKKEDNSQE